MQRRGLFVFSVVSLMSFGMATALATKAPTGVWKIIDDKTGKKRALIKMSVTDEVLSGTIIKIFPQPGDTGFCGSCPGEFKDKPVEGLKIVWGLRPEGNGVWSQGHILDPKSGKIYHVKMTIQENQLQVRGYIGFSTLGRTQIWVR